MLRNNNMDKPFNYRNVRDLPLTLYDYIITVSGVEDVGHLDMDDINEFLNEQEEWYYDNDV
tara:strand:- start:383 stop:565 length:183 start_codon:yes stop_codon:yes gene_type:complete